jgi:hypothetical protein
MVVATWAGILKRFESKVSNPRLLNVRVKYWSGGPAGTLKVRPIA